MIIIVRPIVIIIIVIVIIYMTTVLQWQLIGRMAWPAKTTELRVIVIIVTVCLQVLLRTVELGARKIGGRRRGGGSLTSAAVL